MKTVQRLVGLLAAGVFAVGPGALAGFDVYIWDQCYAMEQSIFAARERPGSFRARRFGTASRPPWRPMSSP